ncbi:acetylornithine transaminase [Jeotgalibacillus proteolyticus]|uniref:Acetylornithine aminotransferase n=1 Tax=Jeotgalibacillus proteolyticus TaxID=2082395 RepID=A0A2S5GA35_9BACL|nr:acetylornithine transaminase [Jeotgalibacillus proteolyticus]PPA69785.1 acetylornithine transaminase [Jeotgalibacillus proteolyticus]
MTFLFNNYARRSLSIVKGKGTVVEDSSGKSYLDFTSGIAVTNLGHAHPAIVDALQQQSEKLWHISNLFESPEQEKLAESLVDGTPLAHAFFCNSGAEANEAAIKLSRKHSQKHVIITFEQSFHGRTFGAMSATGQEKVKQGFGPLLESFRTVPFNDKEALVNAADDQVAAILIEVIQGEGGVNVLDHELVETINTLCREKNILLIIDEVQTGISRTGTRYAYEQTNLKPDIVTLAKGLGNGFPIGAMLGSEELFDSFGPGTHGTTFGGNPLAVSVARKVTELAFPDSFTNEVAEKGSYLTKLLSPLLDNGALKAIRGKGLLLGLECTDEAAPFIKQAEEAGLLVVPAGPNVIRLLPPLTVSKEELEQAADILKNILLSTVTIDS